MKIILLYIVSVITNFVSPKRDKKNKQTKNKLKINMHHLPKAMQYRQAPWAILTKKFFL